MLSPTSANGAAAAQRAERRKAKLRGFDLVHRRAGERAPLDLLAGDLFNRAQLALKQAIDEALRLTIVDPVGGDIAGAEKSEREQRPTREIHQLTRRCAAAWRIRVLTHCAPDVVASVRTGRRRSTVHLRRQADAIRHCEAL